MWHHSLDERIRRIMVEGGVQGSYLELRGRGESWVDNGFNSKDDEGREEQGGEGNSKGVLGEIDNNNRGLIERPLGKTRTRGSGQEVGVYLEEGGQCSSATQRDQRFRELEGGSPGSARGGGW
ncbi:hypothetical protein LIER_16871 [Lithospermum erythrorhizon]|uniref:Uncharacterized protein n=1 Tax=Lithospermum erythrorhizon TaxID=34254 RepID=A0AAV3Q916_LITER